MTIWSYVWSTVFGAIIGGLVTGGIMFLSKVYQRQVKHYNSLVLLETQLNELLEINSDNIDLIPFFRDTITSGHIYFSKLRQFPIDRSHYENLYDINLINDLFTYNCRLRRINNDIDSLADGYKDIKNAYIQHHIQKQDYLVNAQIPTEHLTTLEAFLKETDNYTIRLLAKVRLMLKKDMPLGTKILRWFIHTSGSSLKKVDLDKEKKKLLKEIEDIGIQSQKKIEEVLKKDKNKK